MRVLVIKDCAFLARAIECVTWNRIVKEGHKAFVSICTKQTIRSEEFDTDEEAEKYFNEIIQIMEICDD